MHTGHKTYRLCLHAWLEDVCKVLRHNSYCKWAVGATMVWCTTANKTPQLSSDIVVSCCVQTNCPCHVKSMGIIPMHEWKVPLKYRGMLTFPSRPLGLGQEADTMVWGGYLRTLPLPDPSPSPSVPPPSKIHIHSSRSPPSPRPKGPSSPVPKGLLLCGADGVGRR